MKKSFIYIMVLMVFLSACQDENTFGPDYKPDKMGHMMKLDKADLSFTAAGGSQTIQVRAQGPHWKFDGLPGWLTISQASGIGDMTITFTATENTTTEARTATLRFMADERDFSHSKNITVRQEGTESYITVLPEKWTATSADAATQTITVNSNTTWTCTSSDDTWCTVTPILATVATVSITANTTTKERKATLTFKAGTKEATVEVTQPGLNAEISVSPTSIEFEQTPTVSQTVTVTCNEGWKAESNATWCKVGSTTATSFTVTVDTNQSFSTHTATITVTSNSGKTATVTVTQKGGNIGYEDYDEDGNLSGIQAIDLGLPSGLKWANMNVGASKPEDYGDYFAWGETEPKSTYSWGTYKYCYSNRSTELTKYCTSSSYGTVDNKTVLEVADDAAAVNWGNDWRMPTITEIQELLNNTTYTWTTRNGINGGLFTSMVNGNSIFLPAAGLRNEASLVYQSTNGYYWSASLTSRSSEAKYLYFYSESAITSDRDRSYGRSVRAVLRN